MQANVRRAPVHQRSTLYAKRCRHLIPTLVLLALEPLEVHGRHRERGVVEELTHRLHAVPGVAAQLGRAVAEDMHAALRQAGLVEVAAQATVEGAAREALGIAGGGPE